MAVARKDLLSELRSRELLPALLQFGVLALVVCNFAFDLSARSGPRLSSGILWLVLVFAGLVAFGRTFATEQDSLEQMLLASTETAAIFTGKAMAAALALMALEAVVLPGMVVLLGLPLSPQAVAAALLSTVGLSALGVLFAAMAARTRARDLLLPVLALPFWIPFIVTGARAVEAGSDQALLRLAVLDILFVIVCALAAGVVLDE